MHKSKENEWPKKDCFRHVVKRFKTLKLMYIGPRLIWKITNTPTHTERHPCISDDVVEMFNVSATHAFCQFLMPDNFDFFRLLTLLVWYGHIFRQCLSSKKKQFDSYKCVDEVSIYFWSEWRKAEFHVSISLVALFMNWFFFPCAKCFSMSEYKNFHFFRHAPSAIFLQ